MAKFRRVWCTIFNHFLRGRITEDFVLIEAAISKENFVVSCAV